RFHIRRCLPRQHSAEHQRLPFDGALCVQRALLSLAVTLGLSRGHPLFATGSIGSRHGGLDATVKLALLARRLIHLGHHTRSAKNRSTKLSARAPTNSTNAAAKRC